MRQLNFGVLNQILESGTKEALQEFLDNNDLIIKDGAIYPTDMAKVSDAIEYWDKLQYSTKINLNAAYGSLLNSGCRFNDLRLGQSTTLTGRQVVKHMTAHVNEILTEEYDYLGKSIAYNDTDSVYFSAYPILKDDIEAGLIPWDKDTVVALYDQICEDVNLGFPAFMKRAFHCPVERGEVIKAGREIVGKKALFITKKRYAVLYYDKEGKRYDKDGKEGQVKAMGLDLKRADTPKYMQDFLLSILEKVLTNVEESVILDDITQFRLKFKERPAWEKGTPKRVNNLGKFAKDLEEKGKTNMPGHVRASLNWNTLKKIHDDHYSTSIVDGSKVIVCKLRNNPLGYTSVAYPVDELRLPEWFKSLPFDNSAMEESIINKKIENLIGILNWDLSSTTRSNSFEQFFTFED